MSEDFLERIQAPRAVKFWVLYALVFVLGSVLSIIPALAVTAYAARKAGSRWCDPFLSFVPIVGLVGVIWMIKIMWRWCSLPNRYWDAPALPAWGHSSRRLLAPGASTSHHGR